MMTKSEDRTSAWLTALGIQATVKALPGDVSPRRYSRLHQTNGETLILVSYPRDQENTFHRFLKTTRLFESANVRVPRVHEFDSNLRLMLVEDLGSVSLYDLVSEPWSRLLPRVNDAIDKIQRFAGIPAEELAEINPPLDADRLRAELLDARGVFLDQPAFSGKRAERLSLLEALDTLSSELERIPLTPSHRDFMSRNLMVPVTSMGTAVIDHQDACLAPREYDLASLLNDSLFLSPSRERRLLSGIIDDPERVEGYRRCAVQRTLKATATYFKFAFRGFDRHLPLVPPTLARAALQLRQLPEGRDLPESLFTRWSDSSRVAKSARALVTQRTLKEQPSREC